MIIEKKLRNAARSAIAIGGLMIFGCSSTPAPVAEAAPGTVTSRSQPPPVFQLVNPASRIATDLSGEWRYLPDPFREGLRDRVASQYAIFNDDDNASDSPHALKEYDFNTAPILTVPGSWTAQVKELSWYEGLVWLRRRFEISPEEGRRYQLHFGAANYEATVFLNGERIGSHRGGFTPFVFDVTDHLQPGENSLVVGVDAEHGETSIPPARTDWWNYGGITRPVLLIDSPATLIRDYWLRLSADGNIDIDVSLDGPDASGHEVQLRIPELAIEHTLTTNSMGNATSTIEPGADLQLWSPDRPKLYAVEIRSQGEALKDKIGFRTIAVDGDEILLNGEPIFLRGISLHEETLGEIPDRYLGTEGARKQLGEIKHGLNGNFVRLAHYPHTEDTLKVADELGLLVWSEVPVYWDVAFDNMEVLREARAMLRDNIVRDRNRASIIIWSVANETPLNEARNQFLTTMIDDARALDSTRLVSLASNQNRHKDGVVMVDDPLAPLVDLLSVNFYGGWYSGQPLNTLPDIVWDRGVQKPMIFSEFGAGAYAEFSDPDRKEKFSIEYQHDLYESTIAMAEKISFLRGASPWILKDFKSPRRFHSEYQEFWNRKGLLTPTGERKPAFDVLRAWYDKIGASYSADDSQR